MYFTRVQDLNLCKVQVFFFFFGEEERERRWLAINSGIGKLTSGQRGEKEKGISVQGAYMATASLVLHRGEYALHTERNITDIINENRKILWHTLLYSPPFYLFLFPLFHHRWIPLPFLRSG